MDLEDQYDKLYRYCYFRVRDVQTAEDLVQETFLRWLDHYPGQRERGGPPPQSGSGRRCPPCTPLPGTCVWT